MKKILVVDDISDSRLLFQLLFENINKRYGNDKIFSVNTAINGVDAVEKVSKNDYDIVLMDIQIIYEATKHIRNVLKSDVIIIAITVYDDINLKLQYTESGFTDFIVKPLDINKFETLIKKYV